MNTRARFLATIVALAPLVAVSPAIADPPADLVETERQVSLELAHVRDSGPTDPAKRQQLFDASKLEQEGEAQIKSGDYHSAEQSLLHARDILRHIRDTSE